MGLLRWLSGRPAPAPTFKIRELDAVAAIPELDFVGPFTTSPDGNFKLAWSRWSADPQKQRRVLLLRRGALVADLKFRLPDWRSVANDGSFILAHDRAPSQLRENVSIFSAAGKPVVSRTFNALVYNTGISIDGSYAACQMANSPGEDDSSLLTLFDVRAASVRSSWQPQSGWANTYRFDVSGGRIGLSYPRLGTFDYLLDGHFIDASKWERARLEKGDYGDVITMADDLIEMVAPSASSETATRILSALDRVGPDLRKAEKNWQAHAFKTRGRCHEMLHAPKAALAAYDRALALNPKVGVKRRADQLRKHVGVNGSEGIR